MNFLLRHSVYIYYYTDVCLLYKVLTIKTVMTSVAVTIRHDKSVLLKMSLIRTVSSLAAFQLC